MVAHEDDTLVPNIYACSITTGVASVVVVLIRIWARRVAHGRIVLNTSDWLLMIAWVRITSSFPRGLTSVTLAN